MQSRRYPKVTQSSGVVLTLTPDEVYVEFSKEFPADEVNAFMREYDLEAVKEDSVGTPTHSLHEAFPDRHWLRLPQENDVEQYIDRLHADDRIRIASPVYHREDLLPKKTGASFSNFVLVKLHGKVGDSQEIKKLFKDIAEDVSGPSEIPGGELRRLRIKDSIQKDALEVADEITKKSQLVMEAEPDWMQLNSAISNTPNDTLYGFQWNTERIVLNRPGTTMPDGWDLSTGDPNIVIAILDTGCDLNHEDLAAKYVPIADRRDIVAITPARTRAPPTNTPNDDVGHGTCCAGIAAAESNNNRGVAGVAWNCRIMPIKVLVNDHFLPTDPITGRTADNDIADAIDWAWMHGANVINMSFHYDVGHPLTDVALTRAVSANIVLVAASGNGNLSTIDYPARHPSVIAVGATDKLDQRHRPPGGGLERSPGSPDRECWGSNYGTGLSVMAPGVLILTTDRTGIAGYNTNNGGKFTWSWGDPPRCSVEYSTCGTTDGNYFSLFHATSAATPHVAGLAALLQSEYILSCDPIVTGCETSSSRQQRKRVVTPTSIMARPALTEHGTVKWVMD